MLMAFALAGCTSDEVKVQRVIKRGIDECKKSKDTFAEVTLFDGKAEVLRVACERPLENVKLVDEFHAKGETGPYTWLVGQDDETDIWVLSGVEWETMRKARRAVRAKDPSEDVMARAKDLLTEAQAKVPESSWIRLKRLDNALEMRSHERAHADDPTSLGDAQTVYADVLAWANDKKRTDVAGRARLAVVQYYRDYENKLRSARDNIGGDDEWIQSLIDQARKDGNDADLAKYTKELEEARAKRPAQIAALKKKVHATHVRLCKEVGGLDPDGIQDADAKQMASSLKGAIDCSPATLAAPKTDPPDGDE